MENFDVTSCEYMLPLTWVDEANDALAIWKRAAVAGRSATDERKEESGESSDGSLSICTWKCPTENWFLFSNFTKNTYFCLTKKKSEHIFQFINFLIQLHKATVTNILIKFVRVMSRIILNHKSVDSVVWLGQKLRVVRDSDRVESIHDSVEPYVKCVIKQVIWLLSGS